MSLRTARLTVAIAGLFVLSPAFGQDTPAGFTPSQEISPDQLKELQQVQIKALQSKGGKMIVHQTPQDAKKAADAAKKAAEAAKKGGKKKDEKKPDAKNKNSASTKTVKRPEKFDGEPDPRELELRPNAEGRLRFNFHGQSWPDVVQWLADISNFSLQWEELPGDFLTLTTRRSYTLDGARDIINQQLLSRGFTMLLDGEVLYVVAISKLNKAMIPRVRAEELEERQPNEFVRCSFNLDWMVASDAVTELKPMLSQHGKLYQLASTNRIEAFDTVGNLRAIYELIQEEQSGKVEGELVRQFVIKHRRAEEVMRLVQKLMGINPDNPAQPMSSAQMKQIKKAIAQAQKAAAGTIQRSPVPTVMVLNQPENSILITAEPDKMKIIEQAIRQLDVPNSDGALLGNMTRMKIYRLNTYDPAPLVKLLEDLGELDPKTKLTVDAANKSIMAYASLADHLLISQLIEKVDGSTRTFSVIPLQELDAEQVAGTIKTMMGVADDDDSDRDYFYFGYRRSRGNQEKDKFQVDADTDNNRLLLRANPTELDEIKNLLRKLGEDPDRMIASPKNDRIRVYDIPPKNSEEVLERLRKLWHLDNKLEIDFDQSPRTAPAPTSTARKTTRLQNRSRFQLTAVRNGPGQGKDDPITKFFNGTTGRESVVANAEREDLPKPGDVQQGLPPVRISLRNGQIVVTSNDPAALEEVNKLLEQLLPAQLEPAEDYKIYTMEYVSPFWMAGTLEEFFDIETDSFFGWGPPPKKDKASLSKKKKMRFVTDSYTKTLVVLNATAEQHATIEDLIKRMDQPASTEARLVRVTEIFQIQHSQATAIQNVIKEVYRDLLSGNDKALQEPGGDGKKGGSTPTQFFGSSSTYLTADEDEKVKFSGQLSVSADPISNTLTVSGTASLVKDIGEKIKILDTAAQPASNMRVVPVSPNIDVVQLQKRLEALIGPKPPAQPNKQPNGQQNQQGQPAQPPAGFTMPRGSSSKKRRSR